MLHGFKGFMDWGFFPLLQQRIAASGLVSVAFNVSGSGIGEDPLVMSEEEVFATNTYTRELEDIERVLAHLHGVRDLPLDPSRVGVVGHSRGGGMALLLAARHPELRALVTWCAIDSCDRLSDAQVRELREEGSTWIPNARTGQLHRLDRVVLEDFEAHREQLDVLAACRQVRVPALVVHGEEDPAVETAAAERIHAALASSVKTLAIEGQGHTFGAGHPLSDVPVDLDRVLARTTAHLTRHLTAD